MKGIRTVVVGVDFGHTGDYAIRTGLEHVAAGLAQAMHIVHVVDPSDSDRSDEAKQDLSALTTMVAYSLERRVSELAASKGIPYYAELVRVHARPGAVVETLLGACSEFSADLLIVGTHGRHGLSRLLLGSVAEALVRSAPCPVLVARAKRGAEE